MSKLTIRNKKGEIATETEKIQRIIRPYFKTSILQNIENSKRNGWISNCMWLTVLLWSECQFLRKQIMINDLRIWKTKQNKIKREPSTVLVGMLTSLLTLQHSCITFVIYPKDSKLNHQISLLIITALFTAAKLWNQHRCPTTGEWTGKV